MSDFSEVVVGNGGHYSINKATNGMELLKEYFPTAEADEMNFCLFSTSGVHGTYQTIEEEEKEQGVGVTFVIVQPRIVGMTYGVAYPKNPTEFEFLKLLRETSKQAVMEKIG